MAKQDKQVEAITAMDQDFAQWYTDVVLKAELTDYSSVKGCMILRPYGYAIWENIMHNLDRMFKKLAMKTWPCRCSSRKRFCRRRRITSRALPRRSPG